MNSSQLEALWARHHGQWRDPAQVVSHWQAAEALHSPLLRYQTQGAWWETLAKLGVVLFVTREYEHLVMTLEATSAGPRLTYLPLPHPSGMVIERDQGRLHLASTRNPNQIFEFAPAAAHLERGDLPYRPQASENPLLPRRSQFYAGCFYMHDLAWIEGALHANAVGQNAIVRFDEFGGWERVWWPRSLEKEGKPVFEQNHLQLNGIAAGKKLADSYFSASTAQISARRPGHRHFPVDRRGVIFAGDSREVAVSGLTRPHSVRWHRQTLWVDNSGYGELGYADLNKGQFCPVVKLEGWTRGLCFVENIAFIATSRVIPRFRQYAPGLNVEHSQCGLHAFDLDSGQVLGSLIWPAGNQIFALDWAWSGWTSGFPFVVGQKRARQRETRLFYTFSHQSHV